MKNKLLDTGLEGYRPLRKIVVAARGVYYAVILDFSVAYKVVISTILLGGFFFYRQWLDFSLVLVATSLVIISEIFNTTIETLCDFVEARENPKIGIIKDMAAGAVGVSILVWMMVIAIELFRAGSLVFQGAA